MIVTGMQLQRCCGVEWMEISHEHMTQRSPFILAATVVAAVALLANSNGVAHQQNRDRTGAPGSDNTCQQCHSGGNFSPDVNAFLTVEGDVALESTYIPGATHTLVVNVNSSGSPAGYGVHGTVVFDGGANAGTLVDQDANDCIWLDEVDGRHIFEQNDLCSPGTFEVEWVAPESGSGPITVWVASIAANGNGTSSGDVFAGGSFTFTEQVVGVEDGKAPAEPTVALRGPGLLGLVCGEGHNTTILSMDGRLLHEGHFSAGSHELIIRDAGLVIVHTVTDAGAVYTSKVWCP